MSDLFKIVRAIHLLLKLIGLFTEVAIVAELADLLYWGIILIGLIRTIKQMTKDLKIVGKKDKLLGKTSKGLNNLWNLLEGVIGLMGDHSIC